MTENAKEKRVATLEKKKAIEAVESKLMAIASIMPAEWASNDEARLSLVKSIHSDILGLDKQGRQRPLTDLRYFMFQAAQRDLNPFKKQIHAVYIWDSAKGGEQLIPITGIDGFATIAQRTNRYAGLSETRFEMKDDGSGLPDKAVVDIFAYNPVTGAREVVATATAWWDEYAKYKDEYKNGQKTGNRTLNSTWAGRPKGQLEKCAQALGLRRAFPEELSGLYVMQEVDRLTVHPEVETDEPKALSDKDQIEKALAERKANGQVLDGEAKVYEPVTTE